MNTRLLITRSGCPHCREMVKVVSRINLNLPIDKRIEIIDAWEVEHFDLQNIPLLKKLEEDGLKYGYPFLYISGIVIEPAPTEEMMKRLLDKFLYEDYIN